MTRVPASVAETDFRAIARAYEQRQELRRGRVVRVQWALDPYAPIPYTLTPKATKRLALYRRFEALADAEASL